MRLRADDWDCDCVCVCVCSIYLCVKALTVNVQSRFTLSSKLSAGFYLVLPDVEN